MKGKTVAENLNRNPRLAARVDRAFIRAEESARRTARMYGTPLYVWENGRVVAKGPQDKVATFVDRGGRLSARILTPHTQGKLPCILNRSLNDSTGTFFPGISVKTDDSRTL
jgi:hypothetical protein